MDDACTKYRQIADILCFDLDILNQTAQDSDLTAEQLRRQIKYHWQGKNKTVLDAESRNTQWVAMKSLESLAGPLGVDAAEPDFFVSHCRGGVTRSFVVDSPCGESEESP
jgi:hypothetical protein